MYYIVIFCIFTNRFLDSKKYYYTFYTTQKEINMFGITFAQKPHKFKQIDSLVSRSAQPKKSNIKWLKKHDVTDVINFCQSNDN